MICNLKLGPSHQLQPGVEPSKQRWGRGPLSMHSLSSSTLPAPPSLPHSALAPRVGQGTQDTKQRLLPALCTSCSALQSTSVRTASQRLLFHGASGGPLSSSGLPHPQQASLALLHSRPFPHSPLQVGPFETTLAPGISPGFSIRCGQCTPAPPKGE